MGTLFILVSILLAVVNGWGIANGMPGRTDRPGRRWAVAVIVIATIWFLLALLLNR